MSLEATAIAPAAVAGRVQPLRALQIALGLAWLLDGALQYQPFMFHKTFVTQVIEPNAAGQPQAIAAPITWMAHLIEPRVALFNAFAATVQVLIGIGLVHRPTVKPALAVSFVWVLGVWWFGEGLGMLLTGQASPLAGAPGAVLLYAVIGLIAWPNRRAGDEEIRGGLLGPGGARLAWAALWLLAAALWLMPANRGANATHDAIAGAPSGAGWLTSVLHAAAGVSSGAGLEIAIAMAVVSLAVAAAVLLDWHPRPFLALACVVSLLCWVLGQGLGGIFEGSATDPNAGPLFVLLAAALWSMVPARPRVLEGRNGSTRPVAGIEPAILARLAAAKGVDASTGFHRSNGRPGNGRAPRR